MAIPKFNIPNLCGASPELNNALSKIADLKDSINVNINLDASAAAEALNSKLADVKAGLDGLAPDLPEIPNVNFQSELTSLVSDFDISTPQGLLDFNIKKIELEGKFGDALTKAGKSFDSLISDATSAVGGGGDVCALAPNLELPAGVTAEEIKEGTAAAVEKAQGVKTALENAKVEIPSEVKDNVSTVEVKETLKVAKEEVKTLSKFQKVDDVKGVEKIVKPSGKTTTVTTTKTQNTVKVEKVTVTGGGSVETKVTSKATYSPKGIQRKRKKMLEFFCTQEFKDETEALLMSNGKPFNKQGRYRNAKVVPDFKKIKTKFPVSHIYFAIAAQYEDSDEDADVVTRSSFERFSHRAGLPGSKKIYKAKGDLVIFESEGGGETIEVEGRLQGEDGFVTEEFQFNHLMVRYYYYDKLDQTFSG